MAEPAGQPPSPVTVTKGIALIVVNGEFSLSEEEENKKFGKRKGAKTDFERLKSTFEALGFKIEVCQDESTTEILKKASKVARQIRKAAYDCLVVAISTHGDTRTKESPDAPKMDGYIFKDEYDILYGKEAPFEVDQLIETFSEKNCPSLKGKPKLFFIQGCRGTQLSEAVRIERPAESGLLSSPEIPCTSGGGQDHSVDSLEFDVPLPHSPSPNMPKAPASVVEVGSPTSYSEMPVPESVERCQACDVEGREMDKEKCADGGKAGSLDPATASGNEAGKSSSQVETGPKPEEMVSKKQILARDILTMWSSPPGYFAWHTPEGSPFIKHLCNVLIANYEKQDLLTMLTEVNRIVAIEYKSDSCHVERHGRKVVPSIEHILRTKYYFAKK